MTNESNNRGMVATLLDLRKTMENELDPEWKKAVEEGIDTAIGGLSIGVIDNVNLAPDSNFPGIDDRIFDDLSWAEQEFIVSKFLELMEFDTTDEGQEPIVEYETEVLDTSRTDQPAITIQVLVFETKISESTGMYVHYFRIRGQRDFIAAPMDYRF